MFATEDLALDRGQAGAGRDESRRRAPVFIVCSPRPRVGRTLVARLLTEFLISDGRHPIAFDVNPDDPMLSTSLPEVATPAAIEQTFNQMALIDRLIVNDGQPKVVDLAPELFQGFFDLMAEIDFVGEAKARGIDTVILFICENHARSADAYERVYAQFPKATLVQVHNEGLGNYGFDDFPILEVGVTPLRISSLSPMLAGVIQRPSFSFADYVEKHAEFPTGLHSWISRAFIAFRDLELRLMLEEFGTLFQRA
jgi:hypothetical protein